MTAPHRESQPDTRDADMHPEPTELHRQAASMFFCWPTNAIDLAKKDSDLPELIEKLAQFIAAWERKGRRECGVQTRDAVIEECAKVAEAQAQTFLSPGYAAEQPMGSFCERFACEEVAKAIRASVVSSADRQPPICKFCDRPTLTACQSYDQATTACTFSSTERS
jgi:hypothetical protein